MNRYLTYCHLFFQPLLNNLLLYFRNPIGEDFVSFGGAGFIHPQEITTEKGYAQGDIVKVQIDFRKDPKERLEFLVNGKIVGTTSWSHEQAYFALSVDANGEADFDVKFECDT